MSSKSWFSNCHFLCETFKAPDGEIMNFSSRMQLTQAYETKHYDCDLNKVDYDILTGKSLIVSAVF